MTRKDFELTARVLHEARTATSETTPFGVWLRTEQGFERALRETSPRFNAARFHAAANGYDEGRNR